MLDVQTIRVSGDGIETILKYVWQWTTTGSALTYPLLRYHLLC